MSYPVQPCPVVSCPVMSCPVLSYPVLSCLILSCPVFYVLYFLALNLYSTAHFELMNLVIFLYHILHLSLRFRNPDTHSSSFRLFECYKIYRLHVYLHISAYAYRHMSVLTVNTNIKLYIVGLGASPPSYYAGSGRCQPIADWTAVADTSNANAYARSNVTPQSDLRWRLVVSYCLSLFLTV